jgi:hypothetical protein
MAMTVFQERMERAKALLRVKIPGLEKGSRIALKDFHAMLVPEGIILSPQALSSALEAMEAEGLLLRVSKRTLMVPGTKNESSRLERAVRDLTRRVKSLEHNLAQVRAQQDARLL